jgi:uncharacterized membrane protein (DUF4010 family)
MSAAGAIAVSFLLLVRGWLDRFAERVSSRRRTEAPDEG